MEKLYSEIIGLPVVVEGLGRVARVTDVLIDHKNGSVAAFFVGNSKIIAPIDILFFGQLIAIHDAEDIIETEELLKIKEILNSDIRMLKSRVETKNGEYLGNIYDYYVNTTFYGLTKIIVYKSYIGLFKSPERLIPAQDIIEIKKNLVVVKNKYSAKRIEKEEEKLPKLYPDLAS